MRFFSAMCGALACALVIVGATTARAAEPSVIEGRDNWLFPAWEGLTKANLAGERASIKDIAHLARQLESHNIVLLAAIIPLKARYYRDKLPAGKIVEKMVDERYDRLLTEFSEAGVRVVDLRPAFRDVAEKKLDTFYRADFHWTTAAAEASALEVSRSIGSLGALPGVAGTGDKLGEWVRDRHLGDLAANFLAPDRKREIGPDTYMIRKPPLVDKALIDDSDAPVAVVGNSFVQPYFGFPQALSNAIDRPVRLKWNPGDAGPWATMLEYVHGSEFREQPPKVIVWQLNEAQVESGPDANGIWTPKGVMSETDWLINIDQALKF